MGINIRVTEDHIKNSDRGQPDACMVWAAIQDQLHVEGIKVDVLGDSNNGVTFYGKKDEVFVELPKNVVEKIEDWDDGEELDPFDFDFNLPEDWRERLGMPV